LIIGADNLHRPLRGIRVRDDGLASHKEFKDGGPVAVAIAYTPYLWLQPLIKMAIIAGFTSVILVMLLGQSRVFFSMSRDGLLPNVFSDIHPKFRTPWRSNLLFMGFVSLFSAFAPISVVGNMTSIGTLFAFIIVCAGILIMRRTQPGVARPFRTPWVPLVPVLGILVNFAMMYGLGWGNWARLVGWMIMVVHLFPPQPSPQPAGRVSRLPSRLIMAVMISALVKSMRKAPTSGTTMNARGAGPYFLASTSMQASALAVVPSMNPQNPPAMTADS
jgi:amino acid transporter